MNESKQNRPTKKYRICFFSLNAYPYLSESSIGFSGGAERQQVLLARELVKRGHQVIFIVDDFNQPDITIAEKILIYKLVKQKKRNFPFLFNIFPIWNLLRKVDAEIYYQRCAGSVTGLISFYCFLTQKKFLYAIAHRFDVDGTIIHEFYSEKTSKPIQWFIKSFFIFGLKFSSCIIAQNRDQEQLLEKNYHKKGVIIKSIYQNPKRIGTTQRGSEILWISSIQTWKQPELFFDLAKRIPEAQFRMIGGPSENLAYYESIKKAAEQIPNMIFTGFVPPKDIQTFYEKAFLFINTSVEEGFPNTFLESWSNGIPVISLNVDPDKIICENKSGFHSKNFEQMAQDVRTLIKDQQMRDQMGLNGKKYVESVHSLETTVNKYELIFDRIIGSN